MSFCYTFHYIVSKIHQNMVIISFKTNIMNHIIENAMDIDEINKKYKFLILNTMTGECEILSSDRLVSKNLKEKYKIDLSHMYIKRHVEDERYILKDNILIKSIWDDLIM